MHEPIRMKFHKWIELTQYYFCYLSLIPIMEGVRVEDVKTP